LKIPLLYSLLLTLLTLFASAQAAIDCPDGYFTVKAHPRNAYTKQDGTSVSATEVKEQCRPYRKLKTLEPKFLATRPINWPIANEKFKAWKKEEETEIQKILAQICD
jgi:hypothetical protein